MARGAGVKPLLLVMRLVTHITVRLEAMGSVALITGHLGVFAGILKQFGLRSGMTVGTGTDQPRTHDWLLDSVRIVMAVGTVGDRLAMGKVVAVGTLGHEGLISLNALCRIIGME